MKHYGEYERSACVLLGYNSVRGNVLLLPLNQTTEVEQQWLAGVVARSQNHENLIPILQNETFNGSPGFATFAGRALQIPVHLTKIADRKQAETWVGSSAQYSNQLADHPFANMVSNAPGYRAPEAQYAPPTTSTVQYDPATQVSDNISWSSPPPANNDLAEIKAMIGGLYQRLSAVEAKQLATSVATPETPPKKRPYNRKVK